jgi:hypothetical protein
MNHFLGCFSITIFGIFLLVSAVFWMIGSPTPIQDGLFAAVWSMCFAIPLSVLFQISYRNVIRRRKAFGKLFFDREPLSDDEFVAKVPDAQPEVSLAVRNSLASELDISPAQIRPDDDIFAMTEKTKVDSWALIFDVSRGAITELGRDYRMDELDPSDLRTVTDMVMELQRVMDGKE